MFRALSRPRVCLCLSHLASFGPLESTDAERRDERAGCIRHSNRTITGVCTGACVCVLMGSVRVEVLHGYLP